MFSVVVVGIIKTLIVVLLFVMPLASFLTWGERKWSAWMQDRVGPNRAGIPREAGGVIAMNGLLHIAADGLKMMFKEDFIPRGANPVLHFIAPLIALFPALATIVVVPLTGEVNLGHWYLFNNKALELNLNHFHLQVADLNVGLLYIFAISSLAPYAATIAGWASNNKFSLLGSLRTSSQMISYEVTLGLTLIGVMILFQTVRIDEIVQAQQGTLLGFLPRWGLFMQPLGALLFLACAQAENKRAPFDLPEGESEIVAGYFTEYSSMKFGMFFLGEFAEVVVIASFFTALFLGGYHMPWMTDRAYQSLATPMIFSICVVFLMLFVASIIFNSLAPLISGRNRFFYLIIFVIGPAVTAFVFAAFLNGNLQALLAGDVGGFFRQGYRYAPAIGKLHFSELIRGLTQALTMGVKVIVMCWLLLIVRWTFPRFRYDQVMDLGWKKILPLALANLMITAIWVAVAN